MDLLYWWFVFILCCWATAWAWVRNLWWRWFGSGHKMPTRTMIVLGSGGHTMEMLDYMTYVSVGLLSPRIYVYSKTDELSYVKALNAELVNLEAGPKNHTTRVHYESITRAREVGQSWKSSIITTTQALLESVWLVLKWRPSLVLCNGPGVCVPICVIAKILKIFGVTNPKVVFVESICRVETLSVTGHIMRHVADGFLVQWPQLAKKYSGTTYIARFPKMEMDQE